MAEVDDHHPSSLLSAGRRVGTGPVPQAFVRSLQIPADASGTLSIPTIQSCEVAETAWIEQPTGRRRRAGAVESPLAHYGPQGGRAAPGHRVLLRRPPAGR